MKKSAKKSAKKAKISIGKSYYIRACSYHYTGKLEGIDKVGDTYFASFSNAAWISDSGRFTDAMNSGIDKVSSSEIEPIPGKTLFLNISAIESIIEYSHELPLVQK